MKAISNKKAHLNYQILEKLEAGVVLSGSEIKSVRKGEVSLADSYVLIREGEAYLENVHIASYEKGSASEEPKRSRKLLLHKNEVEYLAGKMSGANLTLVPLRLYFKHNYAKIEVALARGKKKVDKRESLRRKAIERDVEAQLRSDKLKSRD